MRVDLHVHTNASDGRHTITEMVAAAKRRGLGAIAITDHDVLGWKNFKPRDFIIIPGVEWSTDMGHVLLLGLEELPKSRKLEEVLEWAREWNVVPVAPHPYHLKNEHPLGDLAFEKFEIVEAINGRVFPWDCQKAIAKAMSTGRRIVSCSDAHSIYELGDFYTNFPTLETPEDILEALRKGDCEPYMRIPSLARVIKARLWKLGL